MTATRPRELDARGQRRRHLLVVLAAVAYGAVAAVPEPMTWPVHVAVALPVLLVLVVAVSRGWLIPGRRWERTDITRGGPVPLVVWGILIAVFAAVQLGHFFSEPRSIYPTLSSLFEEPLMVYPVRVAALSLWAWLGWVLVDR